MRVISLLFFLSTYFIAEGQTLTFSHQSGYYPDQILLDIFHDTEYDLRYTLDGNIPTAEASVYINPVELKDRSSDSNTISLVPTNPENTSDSYKWRPPAVQVPKSTILKCALFDGLQRVSSVYIKEYFIGETVASFSYPIVSIIMDSLELFSHERGIYIPGLDYEQDPGTWQPGNYFNRGDEWEKQALFTYYEKKVLRLNQQVEIEIHGGASRVLPCKSLRLTAREALGDKYLRFPFFKNRKHEKYKKLILRNAGQDFSEKYFADVLMHDLLKNENMEHQASRQVVVFLNGTYWGIHNLREHYNKYYFSDYHDLDRDLIDYFKIQTPIKIQEGSDSDYFTMNEKLLDMDLQDHLLYDEVAEQIDINNFIDHHISKTYGGGNDWAGNNERVWRPRNSGAKWRWIATDYDDAFTDVEKDSYGQATKDDGVSWPNPEWSTRLFRSLMRNSAFRRKYEYRLKLLLRTTFHPETVIHSIDSLALIYGREMEHHIERWNYPSSMSHWEEEINKARDFALKRPAFLLNNYRAYFPETYLNPRELVIYPNPSTALFTIELPSNSSFTIAHIYNAQGMLMEKTSLSATEPSYIQAQGWPAGFYIMHFISDDGEIRQSKVLTKLD